MKGEVFDRKTASLLCRGIPMKITLTSFLLALLIALAPFSSAMAESRGKALKRAEKEIRAANFDQAEKIYRQLLEHDQTDKEARLGLSFVLL